MLKERKDRKVVNVYVPKIDKYKTFINILKTIITINIILVVIHYIIGGTMPPIEVIIYHLLCMLIVLSIPNSFKVIFYIVLFPFAIIYYIITKIRSRIAHKQSNNESRD